MTSTLLLLSLALSVCALVTFWLHKNFWLWVCPLALSLVCAYSSHQISILAFIPIGILSIALLALRFDPTGLYRFVLVSIILIVLGGLFYHMLPGFVPVIPFMRYEINYGKFIGAILLIGFIIPVIQNKSEWILFLKSSAPLAIAGSVGIILFSLYIRPPAGTAKGVFSLLLGSCIHLITSIIPEEALVRGFVQKEFFQWIGQGPKGHICAVILASCLYTMLHVAWVSDFSLLGTLFVSSIVYGSIYQITGQIETPILCHLLTDLILLG